MEFAKRQRMAFSRSTNSVSSRKRIRFAWRRFTTVPAVLLALAPVFVRSQTPPSPPPLASSPRDAGADTALRPGIVSVQSTDAMISRRGGDSAGTATEAPPAKPRPFEVYGVSGKELAEKLWKLSGHEGEPMEGNYRVMFFSDSLPQAYLLRGGTQVGEFPDTTLPWIRNKIRSGELKRGGDSGFWRNFWNPSDPLQPYMWGTGLELRLSTIGSALKVGTQLERRMDLTFSQRPLPWLLTEIGGH